MTDIFTLYAASKEPSANPYRMDVYGEYDLQLSCVVCRYPLRTKVGLREHWNKFHIFEQGETHVTSNDQH